MMRIVLALLLLLVSSVASAQVYKCTHGGQIAYQDAPCAQDQQSETMHVGFDPVDDLMGCFMAVPDTGGTRQDSGFVIEVRATLDGYELRTRGGIYPQKFTLRRATRHELDRVDEATNMHMRVGLAVKRWDAGMEPAPVGVYQGRDVDGRPVYLAYFRNTYGPALKMACP
jgi:hypothetical protein